MLRDLMSRQARFDGALRGRRVPWRDFPTLAPTRAETNAATMVEFAPGQFCSGGMLPRMSGGRVYERAATEGNAAAWTIPAGAVMRPHMQSEKTEPLPKPEYWLGGRLCRFPKRWSDSRYRWRGWTIAPPEPAERSMAELLEPLSATALARTAIASLSLREPVPRPAWSRGAGRLPMAEEHAQGRLSARHVNAAEWFLRELHDDDGGHPLAPSYTRAFIDSGRDPLALYPIEAAADTAIRVRSRFRSLGGLARVLVRALNGAEMRDLAPAWSIPQRHLAEAGRIRLRAALELCARIAEREVDRLPFWETIEVAQAACAECSKLEARRALRTIPAADNDNIPMHVAA